MQQYKIQLSSNKKEGFPQVRNSQSLLNESFGKFLKSYFHLITNVLVLEGGNV